MMKKTKTVQPTEAELEILGILWENGPSTVRFINTQLNQTREVGYTTTLKTMQIMFEKGILRRDEGQRSHMYSPVIKETDTQQVLMDKLLNTAFGGSAMKMVMQALGNHRASKEEISQIRKLLNQIEGE